VGAQNLGAYGSWVATAPDLEAALARAGLGLNKMLQTATVLKLERSGAMAQWSMQLFDPASEGRYQHELLALCYMLDVLRFYAGRDWSPDLVLTTGAKRGCKGALELLYRAPVLTGQSAAAIRFDWRILACQGPYRTAMRDAAEYNLEPSIPRAGDDLGVIAAVTALSLLNGYPRLDWVASKLGTTRRSLQRRLKGHGTSFAELVERALRERAEKLVAQSDAPLTSIAFELGYSDIAHFSRAFKKWTGMPPSARRAAGA
jgi:AraC-like DNA-binding protein